MGTDAREIAPMSGAAVEKPQKLDAVYVYADECGTPLFEVVRRPCKKFFQRKPDGTAGLDGVRRVPYRLNEVVLAEKVFLCEGEKDVETLRAVGLIASTNPGGANGWRPEFAECFRGKDIIILPDQDAPGYAWAGRVLHDLMPLARTLKRIDLPTLEFGGGGDVTDWLGAGHSKSELLALVEAAPFWPPIDYAKSATKDGEALVRDLENFFTRYVILPEHTALTVTLWALMTHTFDSFDAVPYLVITSPAPRCGKTRLLECLELVASEPRRASNVSEAALFRMIEKLAPTL